MRALPAALLATLLVSGCARDARAKPLPRQDWVARANAICKRADREIHALGGATTLDQLTRLLQESDRISDRQLDELRRLRPEAKELGTVTAILDSMARADSALDAVQAAAQSRNWSQVEAEARRLRALSKQADRLVARYGVHECLSGNYTEPK